MAESIDTKSEDVLGQKLDHCIADTLIKVGMGLGFGSVLSLIVFKRRTWPIVMGSGIGVGMGIANCQNAFQDQSAFKTALSKLRRKDREEKMDSEKDLNSNTAKKEL